MFAKKFSTWGLIMWIPRQLRTLPPLIGLISHVPFLLPFIANIVVQFRFIIYHCIFFSYFFYPSFFLTIMLYFTSSPVLLLFILVIIWFLLFLFLFHFNNLLCQHHPHLYLFHSYFLIFLSFKIYIIFLLSII